MSTKNHLTLERQHRIGTPPQYRNTSHKTSQKKKHGAEKNLCAMFCYSAAQAMNRYRITANWARVAVPVGFRIPSEVPATMLLATDHCMGSTA